MSALSALKLHSTATIASPLQCRTPKPPSLLFAMRDRWLGVVPAARPGMMQNAECQTACAQGPQNNSLPSALPWQRGSCGNNDPIDTAARGTIPGPQEHPTCSWQAGTVPSVSQVTNQLISPDGGVGAQQASLETWQPGNSQFLRWWDGILPLHRPVLPGALQKNPPVTPSTTKTFRVSIPIIPQPHHMCLIIIKSSSSE